MDMERDSLHEEERRGSGNQENYTDDYAENYGVEPVNSQIFAGEEEYEAVNQEESAYEEDGQDSTVEDDAPNEVKYVDKVFDCLTDELQNARTVPMSTKRLVDADRCLDMVSQLRDNFPPALDQAIRIQREKDRILEAAERIARDKFDKASKKAAEIVEDAEENADRIEEAAKKKSDNIIATANDRARRMIDDAQRRAEKLVNESEIMVAAKREAAALRDNARAEAHETRRKAVNDAWRLFDALEKQTNGISEALRARKSEMNGKN